MESAYVHDAGVDVAELLEAKEPRAVGRVIEDVGLVSVSRCRAMLGMGTARTVVA